MRVTGAALVGGVVGRPISHSLSPVLHNAWLVAAGQDGLYLPLEVEEARFPTLVEALRGGSIRGLNVTAPFKAQALAAADEADAAARRAGAANLLLFRQGRIKARNTDGLGLLAALAEQAPQLELTGARVVILGAGGAARGAGAALLEAGAGGLRIVNRTPEHAEALAEMLGQSATPERWGDPAALEGADLVINAVSQAGAADGFPAMALEAMSRGGVVMDMVYRPLRTPFLAHAEALGLTTVDGLAMLIGQAAPSFEAMFGRPPPTSVDARALALEAMR